MAESEARNSTLMDSSRIERICRSIQLKTPTRNKRLATYQR